MTPVTTSPASKAILFVTVNFNGADMTCALLRSLGLLRGRERVSVVVVDNASTDDSVATLRGALAGMPGVRLVESEHWRGYFGAAQWGIASASSWPGFTPEWIIVSNNDVLVHDQGFFEALLAMDAGSAGVIAPTTRSLRTGLNQNPFMVRRPSRFRLWRLQLWLSTYAAAVTRDCLYRTLVTPLRAYYRRLCRHFPERFRARSTRMLIYAPHGSFMVFSRRFFEAGGVLENDAGISGEELIVAQACRRLGLPVVFEPALEVLHNEHSTVGHTISRPMYEFQKRALQTLAPQILSKI